MRPAHLHEEWVLPGIGLPRLDGILVQAEEDPFAAILHDWHPGGEIPWSRAVRLRGRRPARRR